LIPQTYSSAHRRACGRAMTPDGRNQLFGLFNINLPSEFSLYGNSIKSRPKNHHYHKIKQSKSHIFFIPKSCGQATYSEPPYADPIRPNPISCEMFRRCAYTGSSGYVTPQYYLLGRQIVEEANNPIGSFAGSGWLYFTVLSDLI
jgi:hypothetical protein